MDLTTATLNEIREYRDTLEINSDEYNVASNRIAELESQLDPQEAEEDLVTKRANEEIAIFGMPLGAFLDSEVVHISIRKAVLPVVYKLSSDLEALQAESVEKEATAAAEISNLESHLQDRDEEISKLKSALYESQLLAEDNATKRDNAFNELLEAKETIDQLNDKITALTVVVPKIRTNVEGPMEVVEKKKREIYDVEYLGINKNKYKAKFADTQESFEDYTVYKDAKYTEVTEAEAGTFRTAYLAANPIIVEASSGGYLEVEEHPVTSPSYTAEEPPFHSDSQEDTTSAGPDVVEESPVVVGQVSAEAFKALEDEVKAINAYLGRN